MDIKPVAWRRFSSKWHEYEFCNDGDFTGKDWQPLYPESALSQAREEGRRDGMREAADKYKPLVEAAENMRDCKGRYHTEQATTRVFEAIAALNKEQSCS